MVFHIAFAFIYAYRTEYKSIKYLLYTTLPLALFTMIHTSTRGAIIGFVLGVMASAVYVSVFKSKKYLIGTFIFILVFLSSLFILRDSSLVMNSPALKRITHITSTEGSVSSRITVWNIAKNTIYERPVFGWGMEGFNYGFNKYYTPQMYRFEPWFDRAHNMVLDILIWGGVFSLLTYVLVWIIFLWTLHKTDRLTVYEKSILIGVTVAYIFHSLTVFDNLGSSMAIAFILAWVANYSGEFKITTINIGKYVKYIISVFVILAFIFTVYKPYVSNKHLLNALVLSNIYNKKDVLADSLNEFYLSFKYANMYGTEIATQMFNVANNFIKSKDSEIISKYFSITETIALTVLNKDPYNMRVRFGLANFYTKFGFFDKAKRQFDFMLNYSPNRQLFLLSFANMKLTEGSKDGAIKLLKRAYNLDKNQKNILDIINELNKKD